MSGHSKWSTIKRKKETTDAARGKLFSKLSKAISVAVKTGGGVDPGKNNKLKIAIEQARAANMPKANVERALRVAQGKLGDLEEMTYEGFGPAGIAVIAEVVTDNRNRAGQEIKNIFERGGGKLAGPGAVSFNFEPKGLLVVAKSKDVENQMLNLIDLGVEDIEETQNGIEVYTQVSKLTATKNNLEEEGFKITSAELVQKPKNLQTITDKRVASRVLSFLDNLQEHADVQKVFANLDIPEEVIKQI
jgi:YebC/PmpR family DNA-binding regulatory protein